MRFRAFTRPTTSHAYAPHILVTLKLVPQIGHSIVLAVAGGVRLFRIESIVHDSRDAEADAHLYCLHDSDQVPDAG